MHVARPARQSVEVIDLVSNSEDDDTPPPAAPPPQPARDTPDFDDVPELPFLNEPTPGLGIYPDGFAAYGFGDVLGDPYAPDDFDFAQGDLFDDPFAPPIPAEPANDLFQFAGDGAAEPDQQAAAEQAQRDYDLAVTLDDENFTPDACLQRVLELFPDIKHEHVLELWEEFNPTSDVPGAARLEGIIEKLLSGASYPKEERTKSPLKRKRQTSVEADKQRWDVDKLDGHTPNGIIRTILKAEFPEFPQAEVNQVQSEKKTLYKSYVHLAFLHDTGTRARRGRPTTVLQDVDFLARTALLHDELEAARRRVKADREQRAEEMAKKAVEDENLQRSIDAGETSECQACFDDLPMNRQIHCSGATPHFTCYECAETYIKSEIGEARCRVLCTAGCGSGFAPNQLNLLSDKGLLEKLAQLQQEKDIRDAGLDDLEECPFCDYKAILPPIEEDFEFRCANLKCEKVSCRRCKALSHIPFSCEQHKNDNAVNSRHKIEEAMTAAMIRSCNKCKKTFIKDYGCNKMTCPSCNNLQCYVCSESLKDYNHFDRRPQGGPSPGGKCPLYDNVEERHEREVKAAEEAAKAEVVASNPDVSLDDLEIKVSDAVKQASEQRRRAVGPAGIGGGGGAYEDAMAMLGGFGGHAGIGGMFEHLGRVRPAAQPADVDRNALRARRAAVRQRMVNMQNLQRERREEVDRRAQEQLVQQQAQARIMQQQAQAQAARPAMQQPYGFDLQPDHFGFPQEFAGLLHRPPQRPGQRVPGLAGPRFVFHEHFQQRPAAQPGQLYQNDPAPAVAPGMPRPEPLGIYGNAFANAGPAYALARNPLDAQWPPVADHLANYAPHRRAQQPMAQRGVGPANAGPVEQARRRAS